MKPTIYHLSYEKETFTKQKNKLIQYGFQHYFGFPYEEAEIFIEKNGKPMLSLSKYPNHYFNLSHSKHHIVLCCNHSIIGIDIEEPRKFSSHLLERISSLSEMQIIETFPNKDKIGLLLWTLKEAYVKYLGVGLSLPFSDIQLPIRNDLNLDCGYFLLVCDTLTPDPLYFHCFQENDFRITLCSKTNTIPIFINI